MALDSDKWPGFSSVTHAYDQNLHVHLIHVSIMRGGGILLEKLPTPEVLLEQSLKTMTAVMKMTASGTIKQHQSPSHPPAFGFLLKHFNTWPHIVVWLHLVVWPHYFQEHLNLPFMCSILHAKSMYCIVLRCIHKSSPRKISSAASCQPQFLHQAGDLSLLLLSA